MLQSMPIHLLSVVDPPKYVLDDLQKIIDTLFQSNKEDKRSRHWSSWLTFCLPTQGGGLGFRSLYDVSKVQFAK